MASQLTRKEMKQDKFAVEVEHTVDYFAAHRKQTIRYGGIALAVVLIVAGTFYYRNWQHSAREQALGEAMTLASAPVGPPNPSGGTSFPTEFAKDDAVTRAFNKIVSDYGGSEEAYIAEYYLAAKYADAGKLDDAGRKYKDVADHANANYASLAKLALAQIYISQNQKSEGEKLLKDLMDHPTDLVSKSESTIAYARLIGPTRPAEARKLLTPLMADKEQSGVNQIVVGALNDLPVQ